MFFESPRFPDAISYGAAGGPGYSTTVGELNSGAEQRNENWPISRAEYDVAHGIKTPADMDELLAFFHNAAGRAHGFRFRDWMDFNVAAGQGVLGDGIGAGVPTYQLQKNYTSGSQVKTRPIKKPVANTASLLRGGSVVTFGAGAGNVALDTVTGIITFVADASSSASSVTVGATTTVVLANPCGLVAGQKLYLSGFTGADAALVNGLAHTINSVSGAGPFTFILATVTTGKTITVGSGLGAKYPQATETLTWVGEFDVPCRFDIDQMKASVESFNLYSWGAITITEVRT